jgi:hypothetical protein
MVLILGLLVLFDYDSLNQFLLTQNKEKYYILVLIWNTNPSGFHLYNFEGVTYLPDISG